jgi:hypothetical protein
MGYDGHRNMQWGINGYISGWWWFGTFFFHILGIIFPTDQCFSEWLKPPTIYMYIHIYIYILMIEGGALQNGDLAQKT